MVQTQNNDKSQQNELETNIDNESINLLSNNDRIISSQQTIINQSNNNTLKFELNNQKNEEIHNQSQIIDIKEEIQKGNFIPAFICLKKKFLDINNVDEAGASLLHYCAEYNYLDISLFLISLDANINLKNKNNQTPIMIAAKFGQLEIFKQLYLKGANINDVDASGFTPLLHAVQNKCMNIFFILIYLGASLEQVDKFYQGIAHWAAITDNSFLIYFLSSIGYDLNCIDILGDTPIMKAIKCESYQALWALSQLTYPFVLQDKIQQMQKSKHCKYILYQQEKKKEIRQKIIQNIIQFYQDNIDMIAYFIYQIIVSFLVYCYFKSCRQIESNYFSYVLGYMFYISLLYFEFYILFFIFYVGSATGKDTIYFLADNLLPERMELILKDQYEQQIFFKKQLNNKDYNNINRSNIQKLFNRKVLDQKVQHSEQQQESHISINENIKEGNKQIQDIQESIIKSDNFLEDIATLYESNKFYQLKEINYQTMICKICMKFKNEQTEHCQQCNQCVEHFNHHSNFFGKCINSSNHILYFTLIIMQQILLFLMNFKFLYNYYGQTHQSIIILQIEILELVVINDGILISISYVLSMILLIINSIYFFIEVQGIFYNMTRNEIFNNDQFKYLYSPQINQKGEIVLSRKSPFSNGFFSNINKYLLRVKLYTKVKSK